jgi:hypothetical protein
MSSTLVKKFCKLETKLQKKYKGLHVEVVVTGSVRLVFKDGKLWVHANYNWWHVRTWDDMLADIDTALLRALAQATPRLLDRLEEMHQEVQDTGFEQACATLDAQLERC